jgi:hypothetical protein
MRYMSSRRSKSFKKYDTKKHKNPKDYNKGEYSKKDEETTYNMFIGSLIALILNSAPQEDMTEDENYEWMERFTHSLDVNIIISHIEQTLLKLEGEELVIPPYWKEIMREKMDVWKYTVLQDENFTIRFLATAFELTEEGEGRERFIESLKELIQEAEEEEEFQRKKQSYMYTD